MSPRRRAVLVATVAASAVAISTALVALAEIGPTRGAERGAALSARGGDRRVGGRRARGRAYRRRIVRGLRSVLRRAPLHARRRGPRRVAEPRAPAGRRPRDRAAHRSRRPNERPTLLAEHRENAALFRISRTLATTPRTDDALRTIVRDLVAETSMARVWISIGAGPTARVVDSEDDRPRPANAIQTLLRRTPGDEPAIRVRAHEPRRTPVGRRSPAEGPCFRVEIVVDGDARARSSLCGAPPATCPARGDAAARAGGRPGRGSRSGGALAGEASAAEAARQGDALKSALLESVSHDLRTPLASIRAAAGSLMDPELHWTPEERMQLARAIDAEAERLNRLVRNLLDLSRIEAGAPAAADRALRPRHPRGARGRAPGAAPRRQPVALEIDPICRRACRTLSTSTRRSRTCSRTRRATRRAPPSGSSAAPCPTGASCSVEDAGRASRTRSSGGCSSVRARCVGRSAGPTRARPGAERGPRPRRGDGRRSPRRSKRARRTCDRLAAARRAGRAARATARVTGLATGPHLLLVEDDVPTRTAVARESSRAWLPRRRGGLGQRRHPSVRRSPPRPRDRRSRSARPGRHGHRARDPARRVNADPHPVRARRRG